MPKSKTVTLAAAPVPHPIVAWADRDRFDALLRKILWQSHLITTLLDPDKRPHDDDEREFRSEEEGILGLAEQVHEDALAIKELCGRADAKGVAQ